MVIKSSSYRLKTLWIVVAILVIAVVSAIALIPRVKVVFWECIFRRTDLCDDFARRQLKSEPEQAAAFWIEQYAGLSRTATHAYDFRNEEAQIVLDLPDDVFADAFKSVMFEIPPFRVPSADPEAFQRKVARALNLDDWFAECAHELTHKLIDVDLRRSARKQRYRELRYIAELRASMNLGRQRKTNWAVFTDTQIRPRIIDKPVPNESTLRYFEVEYGLYGVDHEYCAEIHFGRELLLELFEQAIQKPTSEKDRIGASSLLKFHSGRYLNWQKIRESCKLERGENDKLGQRLIFYGPWQSPEEFVNFVNSCRESSINAAVIVTQCQRLGINFKISKTQDITTGAGRFSNAKLDRDCSLALLALHFQRRSKLTPERFDEHMFFDPQCLTLIAMHKNYFDLHEPALKVDWSKLDSTVNSCRNECSRQCSLSDLERIDLRGDSSDKRLLLYSLTNALNSVFALRLDQAQCSWNDCCVDGRDINPVFFPTGHQLICEYLNFMRRRNQLSMCRDPRLALSANDFRTCLNTLSANSRTELLDWLFRTGSVRTRSLLSQIELTRAQEKRLDTVNARVINLVQAIFDANFSEFFSDQNKSVHFDSLNLKCALQRNLKFNSEKLSSIKSQDYFAEQLLSQRRFYETHASLVQFVIENHPQETLQSVIKFMNKNPQLNLSNNACLSFIVTAVRLHGNRYDKLLNTLILRFSAHDANFIAASGLLQTNKLDVNALFSEAPQNNSLKFEALIHKELIRAIATNNFDPLITNSGLTSHDLALFLCNEPEPSLVLQILQRTVNQGAAVKLLAHATNARLSLAQKRQLLKRFSHCGLTESNSRHFKDLICQLFSETDETFAQTVCLVLAGDISLATLRAHCKSDPDVIKFCRLCHKLGPMALTEKQFLLKQLNHKSDRVVIAAILALSHVDWPANFMLERLTEIINDKSRSGYVRGAAICAMRRFEGNSKVGERLRELMNSKSLEPLLRDTAKRSLPVWEYHQKPVPALLDWPADH